MSNPNKKFLIYKVLDLIIDHPKDTINIKEVMKSLPLGTKEQTVRSYFRKMLIRHGVVIKVLGKRPATYRIMRRRKINLEWPVFERKKAKVKQAKKEGTMVSEVDKVKQAKKEGTMVSEGALGRSVLAAFYKVQSELYECKKENKHLAKENIRIVNEVHDEIRKKNNKHDEEIQKYRSEAKALHGRIREQAKLISVLRNRLSEVGGKVFRLEDITDGKEEE